MASSLHSFIIIDEFIGTRVFPCSQQKGHTLYSTIKEALTTVAKHSNSKNATISLEYLDKKIKLSIRDCGVFKGQMKKGIGLQVMEERVAGLGGNIVFKNEDGFKIILTIPTEV